MALSEEVKEQMLAAIADETDPFTKELLTATLAGALAEEAMKEDWSHHGPHDC